METIKDSGIVEFLILLLDNKEPTLFDSSLYHDDSDSDHGDQDRARPFGRDDNDERELPQTLAECAFELLARLKGVWSYESN